jgi:hypothetical protein
MHLLRSISIGVPDRAPNSSIRILVRECARTDAPKEHRHVLEPHKTAGTPERIPMLRVLIGSADIKFLHKKC